MTGAGADRACRYPRLFAPIRINGVEIRNRILQTAHATSWHMTEGLTTDRDVQYHAARARGGIGLIITGNRTVHPTSVAATRCMNNGYRHENLARDRRLTSVVHEHGAAIFVQLNHFGLVGDSSSMDDFRVLWSSSATKPAGFGEVPKAMEPHDMNSVRDGWVESAMLARKAGFDGVEVHLANGYLLHQFLSPIFNKRTDEYGGALENRLRFPVEVICAVRRAVGGDYPLGIRLPLDDMVLGGLGTAEWLEIASALVALAKIDFISVSAGTHHSASRIIPPSDIPAGWLVDRTRKLKELLPAMPVMASGGIGEAAEAERIVSENAADMVAMTRQLIADPDYPAKVMLGREAEVTRCIRCNQGCVARCASGRPMTCILNPAAGREMIVAKWRATSAGPRRRWMVVGGGPAGMKAAETLALRGHDVALFEREAVLGGQVNDIAKLPRQRSFLWLVEDLARRLFQLGVRVEVGTDVTVETARAYKPDAIVVANGSTPERLGYTCALPQSAGISGAGQVNVLATRDVLADPGRVQGRVLILDDQGNRHVAGTAELLLEAGHAVHLVTALPALFPKMAMTLDLPFAYGALMRAGLTFDVNCWADNIDGSEVEVFNLYAPTRRTVLHADTVILATGSVAERCLAEALSRELNEVHPIGDCVAPRGIGHAIYEGFMCGTGLLNFPQHYIEPGTLDGAGA